MIDKKTIAIRHFTFADNFLQLVENVLNETIQQGNINLYIGPPQENITEYYRQMTKWSDFRIIIPTLFNFFHGIEVQLKAANYLLIPPIGKPTHNLAKLFSEFKKSYPTATVLIEIFDRYIYPTHANCKILYNFYALNNISDSSQLVEVFRYPYSRKFTGDFNYHDLRDLNTDGIDFFKQIIDDIKIIRIETQNL